VSAHESFSERSIYGSVTRRRSTSRPTALTPWSARSPSARFPIRVAHVAEAYRVLRPGGRLLLLEHVKSPVLPVQAIQRLLDPLSVRFAADHLACEPLDYLAAEGFEVEHVERSKWGIVERVVARKPDGSHAAAS
jgi:SAM-dependent methyltransferase